METLCRWIFCLFYGALIHQHQHDGASNMQVTEAGTGTVKQKVLSREKKAAAVGR